MRMKAGSVGSRAQASTVPELKKDLFRPSSLSRVRAIGQSMMVVLIFFLYIRDTADGGCFLRFWRS